MLFDSESYEERGVREPERSCNGGDDLCDEPVEVGVGGSLDVTVRRGSGGTNDLNLLNVQHVVAVNDYVHHAGFEHRIPLRVRW